MVFGTAIVSGLVGAVGWMLRGHLTRIEKGMNRNTETISKVSDRVTMFILAATEAEETIAEKWKDIRDRLDVNPHFNLEEFEAELKERAA